MSNQTYYLISNDSIIDEFDNHKEALEERKEYVKKNQVGALVTTTPPKSLLMDWEVT